MKVSSFLGRNASCCDFKQLFPGLAGVALHGGTGEFTKRNALFAKGMHFPCVIIETVIKSTTNDRIREISTMDHKKYQSWVSEIDELSPPQKEQTQNLLSGVTDENASLKLKRD